MGIHLSMNGCVTPMIVELASTKSKSLCEVPSSMLISRLSYCVALASTLSLFATKGEQVIVLSCMDVTHSVPAALILLIY